MERWLWILIHLPFSVPALNFSNNVCIKHSLMITLSNAAFYQNYQNKTAYSSVWKQYPDWGPRSKQLCLYNLWKWCLLKTWMFDRNGRNHQVKSWITTITVQILMIWIIWFQMKYAFRFVEHDERKHHNENFKAWKTWKSKQTTGWRIFRSTATNRIISRFISILENLPLPYMKLYYYCQCDRRMWMFL